MAFQLHPAMTALKNRCVVVTEAEQTLVSSKGADASYWIDVFLFAKH